MRIGQTKSLSGVSLPLESKETKQFLLFKKLVYRNKKGETKTEYKLEDSKQLSLLEASKFCDLKYKTQLSKSKVINFFEDITLGKRPSLDPSKYDFSNEVAPKYFSRNYVHSSQALE